jgi:ribose transport system substrate-binding protein
MRDRRRKQRLWIAALVPVLLATLAAASLAGTARRSADPVAAAKRAVRLARAPLARFDGPRTSPGQVPKGKSLDVIFPVAAPLPIRASQSVKTAAQAVGWSARLVNAQGTPQGYVNSVEQAVSRHVDAIVLVAMPVPLLQQQIRKASKAGIKVVAVLPALPTGNASPAAFGLFDYVSPSHDREGYTLGQWVVQDSPGGAQAIVLDSPEFPDLQRESKQFRKALSDAGTRFKVATVIESPVTDILGGPAGVQRLAAALRKYPDAKYMFMLSESWSGIFLQARQLTHRTDVAALGSDGDFSVPLVKKGTRIVMIGPDTLTYGWYAVDALIRAFNGKPPARYELHFQLVDTTNAKSVRGPGITATYDYQAAWKRLWKIK